ncbi:riboflavin synthase, alpha subunit [Candidatus Protochlamydia naegleriophila]|uniref:Riboflavin synthase n=1 Tax=Candidatus Protochlamydia naegleriophila TaxID=389348 RepID=A0A0U5JAK7_9BACT|nr:riboflavin synthase [Candidatus Protochlamydia naegleriophila]CUI16840.1 riboflavin synthase, alpha subunit [Candidatus Protochlamydia naegleriophila]
MFTGIVEELGSITAIDWKSEGARFHIQASKVLSDAKQGDSISVNGCCLTIVDHHAQGWCCDLVEETLNRTYFRTLQAGDHVNLERAIKYQDRLGGHLVQGHIDEIGQMTCKKPLKDGSWWVTIQAPPSLMRYIVHKGSIAIDGVSLTVAEIDHHHFSFAMIPHTAQATTFGIKGVGSLVNLEVDLMAKYIERLITPYQTDYSARTTS